MYQEVTGLISEQSSAFNLDPWTDANPVDGVRDGDGVKITNSGTITPSAGTKFSVYIEKYHVYMLVPCCMRACSVSVQGRLGSEADSRYGDVW